MHVQACQFKQAENLLCDSGCLMGCTTTSKEILRTSNQRTNCCTMLNIISKSHLGKAVRHTHTHCAWIPRWVWRHDHGYFCLIYKKRKGKKRKRRNGNKTLNIVQCDIPEENNTLSCSLTRDWKSEEKEKSETEN